MLLSLLIATVVVGLAFVGMATWTGAADAHGHGHGHGGHGGHGHGDGHH